MSKVTTQISLFTLFVFVLFPSCTGDIDCFDNSGPIVAESRDVEDFHSIILMGIGNIYLTQGSAKELRIETNEEVLSLLETSVSNETLTVDLNEDECITQNIDRLDIYITIPEIKSLRVSGVGNITAQNDFELDDLDITLDGVGNATLGGTVDNLRTSSSGVGNIHAFDLIAENCEILINGVGNVEVTVFKELNVTINGSGNVFYKGMPTVTVDISGSGNVMDAN